MSDPKTVDLELKHTDPVTPSEPSKDTRMQSVSNLVKNYGSAAKIPEAELANLDYTRQTTEDGTIRLLPVELAVKEKEDRGRLEGYIELSRGAIDALVDFAVLNGADLSKFDHLSEVWDSSKYTLIRAEQMPPGTPGYTNTKTAHVFVTQDCYFRTVLHESVHRAEVLRSSRTDRLNLQEVLAGLYGFEINFDTQDVTPLNPEFYDNVPAEDQKETLKVFKTWITHGSKILSEGITEYTVQRANGLTTRTGEKIVISQGIRGLTDVPPGFNTIEGAYLLETYLLDKLKELSGLPEDVFDAAIVEVALTGDIGALVNKFKDPNVFLEALAAVSYGLNEIETLLAKNQEASYGN